MGEHTPLKLIVNGVHVTDAKACHLHEEVAQLREDTENSIKVLTERVQALEEVRN
jgi:hypothetical protein